MVELVRARAGSEHRIERIKDTAVLRLRDKLLPLVGLTRLLGLEGVPANSSDGFIVVIQVGSQTFRHRRRRRAPHRGNRGQADVEQAAPHRHVLRQHHLGDGSVIMIVDPNGIAQALGKPLPRNWRRREQRIRPRPRIAQATLAAPLPRGVGATQGGAAGADHAAGGDRRAQGRNVERPPMVQYRGH